MKITEKKTVETSVLSEVRCNKCGKSVTEKDSNKYGMFWAGSMNSIRIHHGYGSKFDTETWEFDVCDDCLKEFIDTFVIPAAIY